MKNNKKKISNVFHKKTIYNNIKRFNSPIFDKQRIKNYFLFNDNMNTDKKCSRAKNAKSSKIMKHNQTCISKRKFELNKDDEINFIPKKKLNSKHPFYSDEHTKIINYIQKQITFQSFNTKSPNANSNENIINNIYKNDKLVKNKSSKTKINTSESSMNKNKKNNNGKINKKNYTDKIYFNKSNKKLASNKRKYFYTSKLSISLDNILSKTLNKYKNKNKQKSFEKTKVSTEKRQKLKNKFSMCFVGQKHLKKLETSNNIQVNSRNNLNNKLKHTKINLEKNRKLYHMYRQKGNKYKTENITEIMNHLNINNFLTNNDKNNNAKENRISNINPINDKNKNKNNIKKKKKQEKIFYSPKKPKINKNSDCSDYSRGTSFLMLDECCNTFNDPKLLCENNSTNDKSLNTKIQESNKKKNCVTPNIIINKVKNKSNNKYNIYEKNKLKSNLMRDNDGFITYEFDIDNEQSNKINGVKTNNFDVKKPNEDNLKFTFMKDEKESDVSFSHASKIIIGNIDGYKDIIETDIKNNENKCSKCFGNLINKRSNLFNNTYKNNGDQEDSSPNILKKKSSDLSTLLKKEIEPFTFNECNFYDSFNMTNNLDGISSTITNNIINDNKKEQTTNINTENNNNNINDNWNNIPFDLKGDKSIGDISKIVNYSIIKSNNLDKISNNNINKIRCSNNCVNNQSKSNKMKKLEDVNNNCIIS